MSLVICRHAHLCDTRVRVCCRYVPEEVRATVMNFFRVPLNMIVVVVLANVSCVR